MKRYILSILILIGALQAGATDYYFSNSGGNDATGNGSQGTPYQTLSKLNTLLNAAVAGDRFFLKRGDTWYGSISFSRSGNSTSRITIGAYGTGAKPVVTGFTTLPSVTSGNWTQISTSPNIWETTNAVTGGLSTELRVVTIDDKDVEMGRWPNYAGSWGGYEKYTSHAKDSAIIDDNLPTTTNWTGARICIRYGSYLIDTSIITRHIASGTGSRLSIDSNKIAGTILNGWGYIICNDPRTLDVHTEWYYNKSTKKFRVCLTAGTTPANYSIKVSTVAKTFVATTSSYITVDGIRFEGANDYGVSFEAATDAATTATVQNCEVQYCGQYGIQCTTSTAVDYNFLVQNNYVSDVHDVSVYMRNTRGVNVYQNVIKRNALIQTMGGVGTQSRMAVWCTRSNYTLRRNYIDSVGYVGTRWTSSNVTIDSNYIANFTLVIDDGGGTYCGNGGTSTNRKIMYNVIINGLGNAEGTNRTDFRSYGIYLDNTSNNVEVAYNYVANCRDGAFYVHNSNTINVHDNIFLGSGVGNRQTVWFANDTDGSQYLFSNFIFKRNKIVAVNKNEWCLKFYVRPTDSSYIKLADEATGAAVGTNANRGIDSNMYARPLRQDSITIWAIWGTYVTGSEQRRYYTNTQWAGKFQHDLVVDGSPKTFPDNVNTDTVFYAFYNPNPYDSTTTLTRSYMDIDGGIHFAGEQFTMSPYSGQVFLAHTATAPPTQGGETGTNTAGYYLYIKASNGKIFYNVRTGRILARILPYIPQNLLAYSEELENATAWSGSGSALTITANGATDPNGTTTAEVLTEITGVTSQKNRSQNISAIQDSTYTLSGYFKANGRQYVQLTYGSNSFGSTAYANFDLTNGVVTLEGASVLNTDMIDAGNGWYRCAITVKATATATSSISYMPVTFGAAGRFSSYTGDATKSINAWGLQVNTGSLRTYTKTTTTNIP